MKYNHKLLNTFMTLLFLFSMILLSKQVSKFTNNFSINSYSLSKELPIVVIDAGHGGDDPGKVGVNGSKEKDINLAIAKRLESLLLTQDVQVVMTRTTDAGLYSASATNKKIQDLRNRVAIIEEVQPDLVISIHQNSYPDESIIGAQTFYHSNSSSGNTLATLIQNQIVSTTNQSKIRLPKGDTSYYLLKNTSVSMVIVECGFLSNTKEASLLVEKEYQESMAWAIHLGIMQYLNSDST
ncbi:MAG: N-acetylmuramoyl-L-alanine amidase [Lachnospiraceae bacterium]